MIAYTYYSRDPRVKREAEALLNHGHKVDVIALDDELHPSSSEYGIQLISVPMKRRRGGFAAYVFNYLAFFFFSTFFVTYYSIVKNYDIVFVHNMPDFLIFSGFFPKLFGTKLILDVHDPMPELFSAIYGWDMNSFFIKIIILQAKISYGFADKMLTAQEGVRDILVDRGVSRHKIEVIHNLPDENIFTKGRAKLRTDNRASFNLVYTGTVAPRHGLDIAIEAVNLLREEIPEIQFRIIGEGPDIPRLKALAREKNLEEKIIFEGVVPLERIPDYLVDSDVCVVSYLNGRYGDLLFPTKVFESLMVGLPVVCSRTKIVLRYLDESMLFLFKSGDKEDLADQIRLVYSDKQLVEKKIQCAYEFFNTMRWETEKRKLVRIIDGISAK
jgi:glycosyltransferase involved in cell wall biosynthesis